MNIPNVNKSYKALAIILFIALYYYLSFYTISNFSFFSSPVHHDDYTDLSRSLSSIFNFQVRPLSTSLITIMGSFGYEIYVIVMNVLLVSFIMLTYSFLVDFLELKYDFLSISLMALIICGSVHIIDFQRYLGLATNLTSAVFGAIALLFFLIYSKEEKRFFAFWGVLFFVLSAICKEDYLLPSVVLLIIASSNKLRIFFDLKNILRPTKTLITVLSLFVSIFIYNHFIGSAFTAGEGSYKISTSLVSIARGYFFYLFHDRFSICLTITSIVFLIVKLIRRKPIKKDLLIALIILSLIGPYSLLSNHLMSYYSLIWQIWMAIYLSLNVSSFTQEISNPFYKKLFYVFALVSSVTVFIINNKNKLGTANWYMHHGKINKTILVSLQNLKNQIIKAEKIGILTPPSLSPWSLHDGAYLQKLLNPENRLGWYVFVDNEDIYYKYNKISNGTISTFSSNELCHHNLDLLLDVVEDGSINIINIKEACINNQGKM